MPRVSASIVAVVALATGASALLSFRPTPLHSAHTRGVGKIFAEPEEEVSKPEAGSGRRWPWQKKEAKGRMPKPDLKKERDLDTVFENNRAWIKQMKEQDPEFFDRQAKGQSPSILWIGCSDARVPANRIMGLGSGDVFIARNVANQVSHMDTNVMSVLQYAVESLEIPHIVVCGHYDCGGVRASMRNVDHKPPLEQWLRNIRDVERIHADELRAIKDTEERTRRLVELNVIEQCLNLFKTGIVQRRRVFTYGKEDEFPFTLPRIHPFVFDPATGKLMELSVDLAKAIRALGDIYSLYTPEAPTGGPSDAQ